jgi:hypothetical protein
LVPETIGKHYEPIQQLILNNMPPKLFRYRQVNFNNILSLFDCNIWGSIPTKFNDIFDSLPIIDLEKAKILMLSALKRDEAVTIKIFEAQALSDIVGITERQKEQAIIIKSSYKDVTDIKQRFKDFSEQYLPRIYEKDFCTKLLEFYRSQNSVSCFCEQINDLLMWGHYADGHKGFALEYDFMKNNGLLNEQSGEYFDLKFPLFPVVYKSGGCMEDKLFSQLAFFCTFYKEGYPVDFDVSLFIKMLLYKDAHWRYEREWRLIHMLPQNERRYFWSDKKPRAIYIGYHIEPEHIKLFAYIAKYLDIPLKQEVINVVKGGKKIDFLDIDLHKMNLNKAEIAYTITHLSSYAENMRDRNEAYILDRFKLLIDESGRGVSKL